MEQIQNYIDESIAAFPFPWEEDHDADRDGC